MARTSAKHLRGINPLVKDGSGGWGTYNDDLQTLPSYKAEPSHKVRIADDLEFAMMKSQDADKVIVDKQKAIMDQEERDLKLAMQLSLMEQKDEINLEEWVVVDENNWVMVDKE
ncbi:hypothetical protein HK103_006719 [Boothiomyces macroporosus]|uniref:Uncharacterized protein n=1 Tax=Boothiomyces macroporosus TaxID=261099 RepID=A0AAD5UGK5_9FUNG|nr:hypothetical protein HK103_006719 [Boothiomyces macroporosus]